MHTKFDVVNMAMAQNPEKIMLWDVEEFLCYKFLLDPIRQGVVSDWVEKIVSLAASHGRGFAAKTSACQVCAEEKSGAASSADVMGYFA